MSAVGDPTAPIVRRRSPDVLRRMLRDELFRNSGYMMASTVVTAGLGGVFWIVVARVYPAATVGLAAALVSAMSLVATLCAFGLPATLVDRLPRRADGAEKSSTLMAGLVGAGTFAAIGATAVVLVLPATSVRFDILSDSVFYVVTFVAGCVLLALAGVLDFTFVAERRAGKMTLRSTVFAAAKIPLAVALWLLGVESGLAILSSWALAGLLGVATAVFLLPRLGRGYRPTTAGIGTELRAMTPSLPLQHVITVSGGFASFVLPLVVAAELSATANAHFYTTWMVGSLFFVISPAVSWSLFAEGRRKGAELGPTMRRAAIVTASMLAPLMAAFLLCGGYVLRLFGDGYAAQGRVLLTILVLSAVPDAVTNLYTSAMRVRRTLVPAAVLNVGMAAATVLLAWVLLPRLGIAGAGWAWLLAQTAGSIAVALHVVAIRRRVPVRDPQGAGADYAR
jgi:O-antigen/teichoic acid export membrane protein